MPVKELTDAFLRTLTWTRALKDVPEAEGERPIKQITYLNRLDRGLSLVLVYSAGGTKAFREDSDLWCERFLGVGTRYRLVPTKKL